MSTGAIHVPVVECLNVLRQVGRIGIATVASVEVKTRKAKGLASADPGATARGARPWAAGVLDDVAEGCVGPDAAAAEACCAAWAELVGGARPGLGAAARTRALVARLVARVVWPRGGLADGAAGAGAEDAALHGDDAAALPENAGAWAERFEGDAYRWLRDEFMGWCLAAAAGALGAAAYVDAVLAGARRIDARDADVLAAAARCLAPDSLVDLLTGDCLGRRGHRRRHRGGVTTITGPAGLGRCEVVHGRR